MKKFSQLRFRNEAFGFSQLLAATRSLVGTPKKGQPPIDRNSVQFFWTGPPLPPLCLACLRSFLKNGHGTVLYSYDDLKVPEGVQLKDARQIVPESEIFYFVNPETGGRDIAPFADYFRLKLLYDYGGWYCDVDTICLSNELPIGDRVWASQGKEGPDQVTNGQLFFKAGDPVLKTLLRRCRNATREITRRESLGPILMTSVIKELGLSYDMNASCETFYPIRWVETFKLWLPEFRGEILDRTANSVFLPLYQSFPLYAGFEPDSRPPAGSYLSLFLEESRIEEEFESDAGEDVRNAVSAWLRKNTWVQNDLKKISKALGQTETWSSLL